jgi:hypothetical protein
MHMRSNSGRGYLDVFERYGINGRRYLRQSGISFQLRQRALCPFNVGLRTHPEQHLQVKRV